MMRKQELGLQRVGLEASGFRLATTSLASERRPQFSLHSGALDQRLPSRLAVMLNA